MGKQYRKILLFSALIWIGANFHHPITPTLFTDLNMPNHLFGTSYAAMVLGMFLTSPIWGSLGDKYGRSKVTYLAPLLHGIGQIGLGFSTTLPSLVFFRFFSGCFAGGFNVCLMSSIVDESTVENRGIAMAKYSAIMSVSIALGYLVGGLLGHLGPRTVLVIQGTLMVLVGIGVKIFLKETKKHISLDSKVVFIWDFFKDIRKSKEIFTSWVVIFLAITFFTAIGDNSNVNATNYYMKAQLDLKPIVNGAWKSVTGIAGLVANLTLNVWILKNTNIKRSLVYILLISAVGGILMYFNDSIYLFMLLNLGLVTLYTMQIPILQNFAVQGNSENVGLMSGIYNAFKSLGAMFGSIITGLSYNYNSKYPFLIGGIAFGIACLFGVMSWITHRDTYRARE